MRVWQAVAAAIVGNIIGAVVWLLVFRAPVTLSALAQFATVVAAVAAAVAATASWLGTRGTGRSARAALYRQLADEYGREEMGLAIKQLHEWNDHCREQNLVPGEEYIKRYIAKDSTVDYIHWQRRRVSHHYTSIWVLADLQLLDDDLLHALITREQAQFFVEVVREMDTRLQNHLERLVDPRIERFYRGFYS